MSVKQQIAFAKQLYTREMAIAWLEAEQMFPPFVLEEVHGYWVYHFYGLSKKNAIYILDKGILLINNCTSSNAQPNSQYQQFCNYLT